MKQEEIIDAFKAMGHPLRFEIIQALRGGEFNVGEIEERTGIRQPTLSQQLAVLRKAGLVETRKEAKLVFYRLDEHAMSTLAKALQGFGPATPTNAEPRRKRTAGAANFARIG